MSLIRVGLVGAGFIADIHAEALKRIPGVSVTAIADPVAARAQGLADRWGVSNCHTSAEDLIGKVDVAHVLVPPNLHRCVAKPLLAGGLSVLLEKPMAETPEDCAALQNAAASAGVALGVNQNFVFHPAQTKLQAAIRDPHRPGAPCLCCLQHAAAPARCRAVEPLDVCRTAQSAVGAGGASALSD